MPVSHWRRVEEDVNSGVESSELETIQLDVECRNSAVFLLVDDIDGANHAEESCPNVASHARINTLVFIVLLVLYEDW
jgi:hypothetical protein